MNSTEGEDISGPSSLSSDQASLCVIPDPYDSSEEDGFICIGKSSLAASLNLSEQDRAVIVFHSVDEEYPANQDIVCQYVRPDGWEENQKDHICLFKVGWVTKNDAVFMVPLPAPSNDPIGRVTIPVDILPKDTTNLYQFCYMREYTLLGASTPFQFMLPPTKSPQDVTSASVYSRANEELLSDGKMQRDANNLLCSHTLPLLDARNYDLMKDANQIPSSGEQKQELDSKEIMYQSGLESSKSYKSLISEGASDDSAVEFGGAQGAAIITNTNWNTFNCELLNHSYCSEEKEQERAIIKSTEDELLCLKQKFAEVNEEKAWYQDQYHSLLMTVKKYGEDLSSERSEKVSLNGHLAELTISHKMLCSENTRLRSEVAISKQEEKENSEKTGLERIELHKKLDQVLSENMALKEEIKHMQEQLKTANENKAFWNEPIPPQCKCEMYKEQVEDLTSHLSDYEIIKNSLEVELNEEIKLGQQKDQYITELEQAKVNNFQMASNWLASTPNAAADGNALLEMEENVNSTIEALECALKEMEVLRSRKAAINRANRVLREEFMQKRGEWEVKLIKLKDEYVAQVNALQKDLKDERVSKNALLEEIEILKQQKHTLALDKQSLIVDQQTRTMETNKAKMKSPPSRSSIGRNMEVHEDVNNTLLKNLEDARDEYKKLYTEKIRIQEKLSRLQQKVKSKKVSRASQETSAPKFNFMDNVSSSWRATIDELM